MKYKGFFKTLRLSPVSRQKASWIGVVIRDFLSGLGFGRRADGGSAMRGERVGAGASAAADAHAAAARVLPTSRPASAQDPRYAW